ncbi:MAG TPA: hypothetical protein VFW09_00075 [Solirubrobacteraceae bacterium]|nr:hypothetical protein [Solirubrobacteraceae bacterium]
MSDAAHLSEAARLRRRRAPLVGLGIVALFAGLWGGLIRLGLQLPDDLTAASVQHGPLMALGFLGTLISLERAVATGRRWAYAAPLAAAIGALATVTRAPIALGPALVTFGGLVLLAAHVDLQHRQPSSHNAVMGLGAVAWCAAGADWLAGADAAGFAPLLAGFLVLTIVGERLELTRAARRSRLVRMLLEAAIAVFCVGLGISLANERLGVHVAGVGLAAQALWLARYDIARHTVRIAGVTRYMAVALLTGYVWLLCAGVLWAVSAPLYFGPAYDASLHAVFLGFVMSMVFAHAPVIVPAVLRVPLPYSRGFYAQLVLLHVSLAVRLIGGDLLDDDVLWRWGGIANETAILLFLFATAFAVGHARRQTRCADRRRAGAASSARVELPIGGIDPGPR